MTVLEAILSLLLANMFLPAVSQLIHELSSPEESIKGQTQVKEQRVLTQFLIHISIYVPLLVIFSVVAQMMVALASYLEIPLV